MIDPEIRKGILEEINSIITNIIAIKPDFLTRKDLGKDLNLESAYSTLESIHNLIIELSECNFKNIPTDKLHELRGTLSYILGTLTKVARFSFKDLEPGTTPLMARDNLLKEIEHAHKSYFDRIAAVVAYANQFDKEKIKEEIRSQIWSEFETLIPNALKELEEGLKEQDEKRVNLLNDIEQTSKTVRKIAEDVGIGKHAKFFADQAKEHESNGRFWLLGTILMAEITFGFAFLNLEYYVSDNTILDTPNSIQVAISKLVIFGILYFGVISSSRIYKAHRHNYVVNKHRQNALSTFEAFVDATKDEKTKNTVLLQATQSIFSHQHSGYAQSEPEPSTSPQILQMIGDVVKQKP